MTEHFGLIHNTLKRACGKERIIHPSRQVMQYKSKLSDIPEPSYPLRTRSPETSRARRGVKRIRAAFHIACLHLLAG